MLESWGCIVTEYNEDKYASIYPLPATADFNACVFSVCRNDIRDNKYKALMEHTKNIPALGIISTRSYEKLNDFRKLGFDDAVFRTAKRFNILQALAKLTDAHISKAPENIAEHTTLDAYDWSDINVLVVDDNEINLKLARILLENHNASVTTSRSGEQSIEQVKHKHFDLIFMDLQMPGLDGYETTKHLRAMENGASPVIIALTANAMANKSARIKECGMNDTLVKPINEKIMNAIVKKWFYDKTTVIPRSSGKIISEPFEAFSKTEARELAANNEQLANELTAMLVNELPDYRSEITNAISDHDRATLKQLIHKLHGASRCCGTPALRKAASQLESDIDNGVTEHLETGVASVISEIDRLINATDEELYL
jgi:CheY-like chemotaxis protein